MEKEVSFAYQEVPEIMKDIAIETKVQNLGQVIAIFKRDLEDLQALLNLNTPP